MGHVLQAVSEHFHVPKTIEVMEYFQVPKKLETWDQFLTYSKQRETNILPLGQHISLDNFVNYHT